MSELHPPRLARLLLERSLPADAREHIMGDLDEVFHRLRSAEGESQARRWYRREALSFTRHFLAERLRRGRTRTPQDASTKGRFMSSVSWLDFKLGFRMLVKYPVLTVVGGLAMAFAIWVGASTFELVTQALRPALPLDEGDRIVGIRTWDAEHGRQAGRVLHDFVTWRSELKTVEELGAYRTASRNLIVDGMPQPVELAEMSAAGFRVARVAPLMGRTLTDADEDPGAPLVGVIGYDVWQERFGGDVGVIGRDVRLGGAQLTIVGVMPEAFAFPVSQSMWLPLRVSPLAYTRGEGPGLRVFGRLADGASMQEAQAELATLAQRAATAYPETNRHLRPEVVPYAKLILDLDGIESLALMSINLFLVMLLILVCGNVALLMFARAATRETDFVVRSALGASRGRIITQLFTEALVLGAFAAALGLGAAGYGIRWATSIVEAEAAALPFWFSERLSFPTIAYTVVLTLLAAAMAGVIPALKVTRALQDRLRQAAAGGSLSFGGVWTVVIVAQVAVTVAFPYVAFMTQRSAVQLMEMDVGVAEEQYLAVQLEIDTDDGTRRTFPPDSAIARLAAVSRELDARLAEDPAVAGVTLAERLPRMYHPHRLVEMDAGGSEPIDPRYGIGGHRVSSSAVALDYFDVLGAPVLGGRALTAADYEPGQRNVIVNQQFVQNVLGGRNPVGRRFRYVHMEEWERRRDVSRDPWYEIVGVVRNMGMATPEDPKSAGIYHPLPATVYPLNMAVHVRGDPRTLAPRVQALAADIEPGLRLYGLQPLDQGSAAEVKFIYFWFKLAAIVSVIALTLSLSGIYAVMAFTVARRTREIGIRVALGAEPRRIVGAIFRRPLIQVGCGIAFGMLVIGGLGYAATGGEMTVGMVLVLLLYIVFMMGVCALACIVPTQRALRIQPTEALREG